MCCHNIRPVTSLSDRYSYQLWKDPNDYCIPRIVIRQTSSIFHDHFLLSTNLFTIILALILSNMRFRTFLFFRRDSLGYSSRIPAPLIQMMTAGRATAIARRPQTSPNDNIHRSRIGCRQHADRTESTLSLAIFLRMSETSARYFLAGEQRTRVSSMCAGQESKREVRDRRSVGWDWRVAAVPGAEWRVPLWNTAGFEPRRSARLRCATDYYSRRRLLHLFIPRIHHHSTQLSRPHLLLYSPRNIGAVLLLPPAAFSYPPPTLRRQQRRRRCSYFSPKVLPAYCSSSKVIGKMDRKKEAEANGGKKRETSYLSFLEWHNDT